MPAPWCAPDVLEFCTQPGFYKRYLFVITKMLRQSGDILHVLHDKKD